MQTQNSVEQTPARRASQPPQDEPRAPIIKEAKPSRPGDDRAAEAQDMYDNVACTD